MSFLRSGLAITKSKWSLQSNGISPVGLSVSSLLSLILRLMNFVRSFEINIEQIGTESVK
jgi:hypothetical protein